ncbi:Flp family type IVb pilin [Alsobacter sp. SYSU M60028]|uniref:Flp family type IVb pilin n=1 Tax=Alsobacter ponti TaxID=2962936 RepID=A0ABT1LBV2_9HYPH|nr:Flp family type IVb pilin [Alsobacter ponti]MCP8938967.1 Flp family type IVb pilin [Alsobacter ponti]
MTSMIKRFIRNESGATAIEYGLIAAIIGVGLIVSMQALRDNLNTTFTNVGTAVAGANATAP